MRRTMLCAMLCACGMLFAAEAPAPSAAPKLTGDPEGLALVDKALMALGGEEGLKKRQQLYVEQEVDVLGTKVKTCMWTKGEKQRLEQHMGAMPGRPVVIIYDGKDLFLLIDGKKRDPGPELTRAFRSEKKRFDIWWDCRTKPLSVRSLGRHKLTPNDKAPERELTLLEFTHPDKDKTTVGLDPETGQPVYLAYRGPHPLTGKEIPWVQWLGDFAPLESAAGLVFPRAMEIYQDAQRLSTAKLTLVKTLAEVPDELFGSKKERPID